MNQGGQVRLDSLRNPMDTTDVSGWLRKHNELQKQLQQSVKMEPDLKPQINLVI